MPKAVSKKQFRFMQAVMHGKAKHVRGTPPKSVASKYSSAGKGAPEQHGENRGGNWDEAAHGRDKERTTKKRQDRKKEKKKKKEKGKARKEAMSKSFEQYYNGRGAGVIVTNPDGDILVGQGENGKWQTPGGHVDAGEDFQDAAHRELREEANIVAGNMHEIAHFKMNGNDSKVFAVDSYRGQVRDSDELKNLEFVDLNSLLDRDLRDVSYEGIKQYAQSSLKKSNKLRDLVALEKLNKNIMRGGVKSDVVYDVSHGDALRLVGNGCFRFLKRATEGMGDEDFRDVKIDNCTLSIRKHNSDVYSGRITDGHKVIHQFTNKSMPQLCADVMSVFEWYSDQDEHVFDILDEQHLPDDAIHGGLSHLSDNYKRHNLANIYTEMDNVRQEIRNGNAVDLQQVEHKIMKLFDKLEETVHEAAEKHNELSREAGNEIEMLEGKLRDLQNKVDELHSKPTTVEAYQSKPVSSDKVYSDHYMYLPKPKVEIGQSGKITITFDRGWTDMEKSNFLSDMKAKMLKKA